MRVAQVSESLSDPAAPGWGDVPREAVRLEPVPLDAQPTEYVRVKWADLPYGTVGDVDVAVAVDGDNAYVRLEWADDDEPNTEFPDCAAVFVPANGDAPARTIGDADAAVDLVLWQPEPVGARSLVATGPGRFRPRRASGESAAGVLVDGRWSVVVTAPATRVRDAGRLGVVVWNGSNEERAGLGASSDWVPLELA